MVMRRPVIFRRDLLRSRVRERNALAAANAAHAPRFKVRPTRGVILVGQPGALHLSWFSSHLSQSVPLVDVDRASVESLHDSGYARLAPPRCAASQASTVSAGLHWNHRSAAPTATPDLQLGLRVDVQTLRAGLDASWIKKRAGFVKKRRGANRMNHFPDRSFLPSLAPAVCDVAALFEQEGSHEANARQRNSGRGVARRTG